jgi:hypothetical protein
MTTPPAHAGTTRPLAGGQFFVIPNVTDVAEDITADMESITIHLDCMMTMKPYHKEAM